MKIEPGNIFWQILSLSSVFILVFGLSSCAQQEPIKIIPPPPTATLLPTPTPTPIQVYISGKVVSPDVYILDPGSRIKQLVEAAGGFAEGANTDVVNLAQPLTDGAHVHIPAVGEEPAAALPVLSDPVPQRSSGEIPTGSSTGLVNINLAQRDELESLPGIGPVTAQHILDFRDVNGSFRQIEDIMDVPGIGEGKFEQIRALITVGN